jgi:hypothetical protein
LDQDIIPTNVPDDWNDQVEKTRAFVIEAPQGYYCPEGCQEPLSCPIGSHSYDKGSVECTPCPVGYWCPYAASTLDATLDNGDPDNQMIPCPRGFWCSTLVLDNLVLKNMNTAINAACTDLTCSTWDATLWAYEPHACEKGSYNPDLAGSAISTCVDCP